MLKKRVVQNTAGYSLAKATTMKATTELIPTAMSPTAEMIATAMYDCLYDRKMYKIGEVVVSGSTREGCGFALVCVEGGHLRTDREEYCFSRLSLNGDLPTPLTTVKLESPQTPLTPLTPFTPTSAGSGCVFEGKLYRFGETIQSNKCYSTMCDYTGAIIFGENLNCFKTPPTPPIIHVG